MSPPDLVAARLLALERRLDYLVALIEIQGDKMSVELDNLVAQVTRLRTSSESVVTLVKGLADQIVALKTDPAKLQELADSLKADADAIDLAVHDNTPTPLVP